MTDRRTLLLVPTELELARLSDLGGFPDSLARVEICGFGPVAAAARTAELLAHHFPPAVLLVGIAGSFAPLELPVGSAASFREAAIEGIGVGEGERLQAPPALGFPQWPAQGGLRAIEDRLALAPAYSGALAPLLLSTCAASDSPAQAALRRRRFPDAAAEDMEGFSVAFACALARVPCTLVRGISNAVGDREAHNWRIPAALAAARTLALAHLERGQPRVKQRLAIGLSPCPNDTFAFHALLERRIETPGLELDFELRDIEQLNRRFLAGGFDACKVSFAALAGRPEIRVLSAGAALGFGVGPVLVAARGARAERGADGRARIPAQARVLCPGEHTSASLLYRLFHRSEGRLEQAVFSDILPALAAREAEFGVCIHEGRFTYAGLGLELVEDLGARWEERERAPLPLGGIAVREGLSPALASALEDAIVRSIDYAHAHREEALATMRAHAQEQSDAVLWQHVELYVSDWTRSLGPEGARALARLRELAGAQLP